MRWARFVKYRSLYASSRRTAESDASWMTPSRAYADADSRADGTGSTGGTAWREFVRQKRDGSCGEFGGEAGD
ncbi:hypothetical protein PR002_g30525 [Phytophthora rubi]|uniref:Uncharacterized protein n=1 Tax=Phytophthora rubi TaxID=129364 RepID=A0A6A3GLY3_9STRA|nr:hypothetical protein PR002_g30525 [Phytophthora rubi]